MGGSDVHLVIALREGVVAWKRHVSTGYKPDRVTRDISTFPSTRFVPLSSWRCESGGNKNRMLAAVHEG